MATQVQPENQDPSDTTQITPPSGDPADNQPPAPPNPPSPGVDPTILQAYQEQLQVEMRERARLQRELEESRKKPVAPPTPEQEKEFFDKPVSTTRDLIREEIQKAIAPLNQFTAQTQRAQFIEQCKTQMRANPSQFPYIDQVERLLDQILSQTPNLDVNSVVAAYNLAVGTYISQGGSLTAPNGNNPPTPPANRGTPPVNNPPHVRPTPPVPPPSPSSRKIRPLTENEKKIARFNRFTDEEYLVWSGEIDATEVAHITDEQVKERVKKIGGK